MGSNADDTTKQAGGAGIASPSEQAQATNPSADLEEQPAAVRQLQPQSASEVPLNQSPYARSGSPPSRVPANTEEQGLQEADLQPLQDADLVVDISLPPPQPAAQTQSSLGYSSDLSPADCSSGVQPASSLPRRGAATEAPSKPAAPGSLSSPFGLVHSTDSASSSSAQQAPPQADKSVLTTPEARANSSLQPATPPLQTPTGQTPASRPASEQEGEPPPSVAVSQGSLQGIAKGIQAAIERKLRYVPSQSSVQPAHDRRVDADKGLECEPVLQWPDYSCYSALQLHAQLVALPCP